MWNVESNRFILSNQLKKYYESKKKKIA